MVRSRYCVPCGTEPPLRPASVLLVVASGDLRFSGRRKAVLGLVLAGGLWVDVPGALPVGAVAHAPVVHVHPLACRDYPAPGVTVGTFWMETDVFVQPNVNVKPKSTDLST